tara:strand:- start:668 stop:988 length:321 start_codon:yes stop_codon:yes gene_type:complete
MLIDIIGYSAIIIGAISLTPQIIQMIKTKKVRDINIYFLFIAIISDILYFVYSILSNNYIFIYSVIPPVLSHVTMLFLWLLYNKQLTITNIDTHIDTHNDIEIIII